MLHINSSRIEELRSKIKGHIVLPEDHDYNEIRAIWNGMIDKKPAMIVQVASAEDVPHVIHFARDNEIELSIRGAGHHIAGNCLVNDGITIDFSLMKKVTVDAASKTAYVQPGATLADFDKATLAHGLATPVGINSTTGIAGLTLGGGFGWLTRQYGLTIDNLLSADIVTAKGETLKASKDENPDLFWAVRGGGGNFGVVTGFRFKLHEINPEVFAGLIVFPFSQSRDILKQYREFTRSAPPELNVWVVLRHAPPLPFLPEEVHGKMVLVLAVFYNGDTDKGENLAKFLKGFGDPVGEHTGTQPYVQWQQAFDPLLTPGARNYWKSHNFTEISDELIDTLIAYSGRMPSMQTEIFLGSIEGAANKIPSEAMAYPNRDTKYVANVHGRWENSEEDDKCIDWCRAFFNASLPFASEGAYVNFMTEEETDRISAAYRSNYDRLVELKQKYDPENLFHMNQNIKPKTFAGR